jgi:short subunit dehydrogenase-like uncharacterized protein
MQIQYDYIIWGATSFVGFYVVERFLARIPDSMHRSIAIAGRSEQKLNEVNRKLGTQLDVIVGDANDNAFISQMVAKTNVVISTVGPYALYGELLVKEIAVQGKDYCDLTGEPQWIWEMLDKYEEKAKKSGARILHCCGFDSIPSDVGVFVAQQKSIVQFGKPSNQIRYRFKRSKGGFSGGTIATMVQALKDIKLNKRKARLLKTPYALVDTSHVSLPYQKSVKSVTKDKYSSAWLVPFIMASINTKIVHRTNSLLGFPWGTDFRYDESMMVGKGLKGRIKGIGFMIGLVSFLLGASYKWPRAFLQKFVLPKPGEGPDAETVYNGYFHVEMVSELDNRKIIKTQIKGKGDPGYGSTSKMITEVAVLLNETCNNKSNSGFLTPISAFQNDLVDRLQEYAEIEID